MSEIGTRDNFGPRAPIYGPGPIGVGTADVESLVSYVQRLAAYHHVSSYRLLMCRIPNFDPCFNDAAAILRRNSENTVRPKGISGYNADAEIAKALATLTGRPEITETDFFAYSVGACFIRFMRQSHAWCPQCLQNDTIPYERLLWKARLVTVCPRHQVRLQTTCPHCGHPVRHLLANGEVYLCRHCEKLVYTRAERAMDPLPSPVEIAESDAASQLCHALFNRTISLTDYDLVAELCRLAERHGASSLGQKSRFLSISKSHLSMWIRKKHAISLVRFIELCASLGITPLELLLKDEVRVRKTPNGTNYPRPGIWHHGTRRVSAYEKNDLIRQLEENHRLHPELGLNTIARVVGCEKAGIRHWAPAICRRISAEAREERKKRRSSRIRALKDEVASIIRALVTEGRRFNTHHISRRMKSPAYLRDPEIRAYATNAIKQINGQTDEESAVAPARAA